MYLEPRRFSGSGSGSGVHGDDEIAEALIDLANEINFTPDDDNTYDIKSIDAKHQRWTRCLRNCSESFGSDAPKCHYYIFLLK